MFSLTPHDALYSLVLNSSLNGVIEQDVAAITAAFHIYILVGVSLYCSEAVIAAFPCRAVVVVCSLRWPAACDPPGTHLSISAVLIYSSYFPVHCLGSCAVTLHRSTRGRMSGLCGLSRAARLTRACD